MTTDNFTPNADTLYLVPLGGAEQYGVNFNLYGLNDQWLIVDCGIGFADHSLPLVDITLPDPQFAEARKDKIVGLIVTHAHEDHLGAVPRLWERLGKPHVYCTRFTAELLKTKNAEMGITHMHIHVVAAGASVDLDPFGVDFIHVAHSTPDSAALRIRTALGNVLHSGDWHLDPAPAFGDVTAHEQLQAYGDEGILAYVGDSTNAGISSVRNSEKTVEAGIAEQFREIEGRIAVTIMASNVGRLHSIAQAAKTVGRSCVLIGRSLHRMLSVAKQCGYMLDINNFITQEEAYARGPSKVVLVLTGSQGETNAALSRIARGEMKGVRLSKGDTVIFSARVIPGNEVEINQVVNNLLSAQVKVINPDTSRHIIYASGHPYRDEIKEMFGWVRPHIVIPVHGERAQLEDHANVAREMGVKHVVVPHNGSVIKLAPGNPEIITTVPTGTLAVEPSRVVSTTHKGLQQRRKLQFTGAMHVSLVLNRRGQLAADPHVTSVGIVDPNALGEDSFDSDMAIEVEDILADMREKELQDPTAVAEILTSALRGTVQKSFGFKPKITVHVMYTKV
ncbi:MAG: ribonuclease J [Pseudomonadota bacterium]